ncbi:hypothetical protein WN55_08133 [Dufourea novaeangliae]|uniref:Uncharacterized protein n=1 Tax=Dufourea novaeangliae TaxID=178035 RepID=A0A154P4M2_DUFNO|nr:hypothetical protein WN55_08133 [Dufourea novaeangliae]
MKNSIPSRTKLSVKKELIFKASSSNTNIKDSSPLQKSPKTPRNSIVVSNSQSNPGTKLKGGRIKEAVSKEAVQKRTNIAISRLFPVSFSV